MKDYYILKGKTPVKSNFLNWSRWMREEEEGRIVDTFKEESKNIFVSTVFLTIPSWGAKSLLFFETLYRTPNKEVIYRYEHYDVAKACHDIIVEAVKNNVFNDYFLNNMFFISEISETVLESFPLENYRLNLDSFLPVDKED